MDRGLEEVTHPRRVVGERPQPEVLGRDVALGEHPVAHPVDEPANTVSSATVTFACMKSWGVSGVHWVDGFPLKSAFAKTDARIGTFHAEWPFVRHW